jgi:hypothetical protein
MIQGSGWIGPPPFRQHAESDPGPPRCDRYLAPPNPLALLPHPGIPLFQRWPVRDPHLSQDQHRPFPTSAQSDLGAMTLGRHPGLGCVPPGRLLDVQMLGGEAAPHLHIQLHWLATPGYPLLTRPST